ncbi:MAG: T9SS type A sorting domain-containing protein [Saprospiraceae bacterium]|nr:T9SS type A sorting domain-containing protein [Saprospiraceae bacterium]
MKRPSFTQKLFLKIVSGNFRTITAAFSIFALTLIFSSTSLQAQIVVADCNSIMSCNGGVQISLDDDCLLYIEPKMILKSQDYPDSYYDVEAKLPNGTALPQTNVGMDPFGFPIKRVAIDASHIGKTLQVKVTLRGCGNSCWGPALIEDKLKPEITACPCEERITDFTGIILGSGPSYNRPSGSLCDMPPGPGVLTTTDYITFRFAVDASGIVDINLGQTNMMFNLYNTTFNPASPCTGRVSGGSNTRSFSAMLTSGVNYELVVSLVTDGNPLLFYPVTTLTIDSRVGNIKSSVLGTVCTLPCNGEASLLAQTPTSAPNPPIFTDACGGVLKYFKKDSVYTQQCGERYSKIIKRSWTATDASGNVSDVKIQYYYVQRATLVQVNCPDDWIKSCNDAIFTSSSYKRLPNGAPHPDISGQPSNISCQNIQVYYVDVIFDLCGAGLKVARQWNIIDWCTGDDKICLQTIKIEDDVRPVVTCPADITTQNGNPVNPAATIPTSSSSCTANWDVLPPTIISECSGFTWDVAFKKADSNGNPPPGSVFVKIDGATKVVGISPAFASALVPGARPFKIENLPLGRTWLKYTITDECGNFTECFTEIDVVDKTPPSAICDGSTVISLDDSGWADLYAESLDDHSLDNCSVKRFEIKRKSNTCASYASDLNFGPKINFCCTDITNPDSYVSVVLRVYDAAGNFNDCETVVRVQNKRKPIINCPADKTLACGDGRIAAWVSTTSTVFDTSFFGKPTVTGVCGNMKFNSRIISNSLNTCGFGSVVREWFVVNDPTVTCRQTLNIPASAFNANNVVFPADREVASCNPADATPEILNSKPIVTSSGCSQIGISSTDQLFYNTPEACVKILRTWRVIDWCTYTAANGPIFEKTQVIKLKGSNAPMFTSSCSNQNLDTEPNRCDKDVTFTATAKDDCTDVIDLRYTWTLDINKNNSIDAAGSGSTFTRTLDVGTHRVSFVVTNRCGTRSTCAYDVTIKSTKKPTPVCYGELVWVVDAAGKAEVWAKDFDLKSDAACGSNDVLKFSFNEAGTQPSRMFTCADILNGQVARIPLKMYVIDASGNRDFCNVTLVLQDSPLTNACQDVAGLLPNVAGRITTEMEEGIDEIDVALTNMNNAAELKDVTKNHGEYKFSGVDVFDPKTITAHKNTDILNGVSTLDLVLIQRHILGLQKIDSPYKLLAGDVNNSRSITASDLTNLRKLILGITLEFENNTSWRFVPSEYIFTDAAYPFDFPSKINLDSIFEDKSNVNFKAIKVGDVNNSAKANATSTSSERRAQNVLFVAEESTYEAGTIVKYTVKASDAIEIMGAQMAIKFNENELTFSGMEADKLNLKSNHINALNAGNGKLSLSYDIASGTNLIEDDKLFTLVFKALKSGNTSHIKLDNEALSAEVYEQDATVRTLSLQSRKTGLTGKQNALYQNEPNPFKEGTNIAFEVTKASNATLRIMDVTGKLVFTQTGKFDKGYHVITVDAEKLAKSGVYYYQIEAGEFIATRKMILIE